MSLSGLLEDFGTIAHGRMLEISDVSLEEEKLAAFEKGYQAGWEDSNAASNEARGSHSADLIDAFREISCSLKESQCDLMFQVKPLLDQIVSTFLPKIAQNTLGPKINEVVHEMLDAHGHQPIQIHCATEHVNELQNTLYECEGMPISIAEDPQLKIGQVHVKFGGLEEQAIDFTSVIDGITEVIDTFFKANTPDIETKDVA